MELSQPQSAPTNQSSGRGNDLGGRGKLRKQWEDVIDERLKAKTRIISKVGWNTNQINLTTMK